MAKVLVTEQYLSDIGDAIRSKNGETTTYTPSQMADAIAGLNPVPTNVSAFTNDANYVAITDISPSLSSGTQIATVSTNGTTVTLYAPQGGGVDSETDPVFSASVASTITATDISNWNSKSAGTHTHGSITNAGSITSNTALASNDRFVFSDNSDSGLLKRSSIAIGSSTNYYLANNGTWQQIPTVSVTQSLTAGTTIGTVGGTTLYAPTPYNDSALVARVAAIEDLEWVKYYSGRTNPASSLGQNGDIYLQY